MNTGIFFRNAHNDRRTTVKKQILYISHTLVVAVEFEVKGDKFWSNFDQTYLQYLLVI